LLIYLSQAGWARRIVTGWRFARRAASRFIAGDTLSQAIEVIQQINESNRVVTLDHLGEHVINPDKADVSTEAYLALLEEIDRAGVRASVSLKLTQLGLNIDSGECLLNLKRITQLAADFGNFIRIDMEDSPVLEETLEIFKQLSEDGFTNVGMVIQSYLYRSQEDTVNLLSTGTRIRLVKGAYQEPPEIAFPNKKDVDQNFDRISELIIDAARAHGSQLSSPDGKLPPITAIATHDENRIKYACEYADRVGLPKGALEFQMLYGIRTNLQLSLVKEGYPVRVYVPYGMEWYPYFVRRLAERPANLWFFLSNFFRR
jgi:proline dehydrogenase